MWRSGQNLAAILSSLAEAVTVQTLDGELVYANDVAARILGADSPEELLATPPAEIMGRFETFNEDGSAVRVEQLPGRRILAGEREPEPLVVRAIDRRTGEERWRVTKATAIHDDDGTVRWACNIIDDITEVKRAELAQRFLSRASEALSSSLDFEDTLGQVARLAVPQLADWCGVAMPDDRGVLMHNVAIAHVDPGKAGLAAEYNARWPARVDAERGSGAVLRSGRSEFLPEISDDLLAAVVTDPEQLARVREIGMRGVMIVPMLVAGKPIGTISFVSAESGRTFTRADLEVAEELGRRAGTAVENARLYTERSHIASTLQTGLLPPELPEIAGFQTATLYRPAGEENWVGGDFYDAVRVRDGWLLIVGDVAGRGAEAASLTGLARYTLRSSASLLDDPLQAVGRLNEELLDRIGMSLCSVCCVLLRDAQATIVCAGHPLPCLVRDGHAVQVGRLGPMLGAFEDVSWHPVTIDLLHRDQLVLYTDGVLDTVGAHERFGERRLLETLAGAGGPADAVARIDRALDRFQRGSQADDTAVLAVARVPVRSFTVPGSPYAPKTARNLVVGELAPLLDEQTLDDVRVLVSELVTNAIIHGGADEVSVQLEVSDRLVRVAVADPGTGFARADMPAAPRPEGGGNGLLLVDAIASRWDVGPAPGGGNRVWFEIDRSTSSSG